MFTENGLLLFRRLFLRQRTAPMLRKASGLFLCAAILLTQSTSPLASNLCGQTDDMLCSLRGALGDTWGAWDSGDIVASISCKPRIAPFQGFAIISSRVLLINHYQKPYMIPKK